MKTLISKILILLCATSLVFAHSKGKIGPNEGHLLKFGNDFAAEVTSKDGKFIITLLNTKNKPVETGDFKLSAISGDRSNPQKFSVEKNSENFQLTMPEGKDYWIIFQLKRTADAKAMTARFHYNSDPCGGCKKPEWLCTCGH